MTCHEFLKENIMCKLRGMPNLMHGLSLLYRVVAYLTLDKICDCNTSLQYLDIPHDFCKYKYIGNFDDQIPIDDRYKL